MQWNEETVFGEIRTLLEPYNTQGVQISLETEFSSELSLDSVAAMNLIMEIEDRFEVDFPISQLPDMNRSQDLVNFVLDHVKAN